MPGLRARAHRRAKSGGNSRLVHLFKNEAELFLGPTWTRSAPTPLQASLAGAQRHFLFIVSVMGADPRSEIFVFLSGFTFCGPDLGRKTAPVFGPCCFTDRPFASHDVAIRQYLRLHEVSGSLDTPSKLYTGRIGVSLNLLQKHLRVYGVSQSP